MSEYSQVTKIAQKYYDSNDADQFYYTIWGGEDIHIGIYSAPKESIYDASRRTVQQIADLLNLQTSDKVLDIGSGYGGSARYLASNFGCHVTCLNLSEVQNKRNISMNTDQNLTDQIRVIDGSFENIPLKDDSIDVVWSQDAILHSGNKEKVFAEVARVLKSGGDFIFTDPMQSDNCPEGVLQPVLDRIHLDSMGSPAFYKSLAQKFDLELIQFDEQTEHLVNHYTRVREQIEDIYSEIIKTCNVEYIDQMKNGLLHWMQAGQKGYLSWGILHFRKAVRFFDE